MEKILYLECLSGISGDMMTGALLDLGIEGLDIDYLRKELKKVDLEDYEINRVSEKRGALFASRLSVKLTAEHHARDYQKIKDLINASRLNARIKKTAISIFDEIAEAESFVHKIPLDKIHFHEIGAVDSIIDIVSVAIALDFFKPEKIFCSNIPLGKGIAETMHGKIPIPAPATVRILRKVPVFGGDFDFETTTPTGAAIIKAITDKFCNMPEMQILNIGYGTGTRIASGISGIPNILRLFFGSLAGTDDNAKFSTLNERLEKYSEKAGGLKTEELVLLSANIDDMSGEMFGHVLHRLFLLKINDAWTEPIYMKKNRPAIKLCALCSHKMLEKTVDVFFKETSTLGIRIENLKRISLNRHIEKVKLPYGEVFVKTAVIGSREVSTPEYDSCAELAEKTGKTLKEVYRDLIFFLSSR
ncbi:MAG: nickel pincer cofactor biosynthesis protein LarC [Actinobacteria bacterium]|nr:nickel pincer cofactor biosynthesis protein LarC [Actinomycetota bacterium]